MAWWHGMVDAAHSHPWHGMVEVWEGAPVAVSGWVLTDRHDLAPCAANSLHRETMSGNASFSLGNSVFWRPSRQQMKGARCCSTRIVDQCVSRRVQWDGLSSDLPAPCSPMARCVTQGFSGSGARMPARSVCLVTLSLSEAGPGRFGRQASVTDIYHAMPWVLPSTQPAATLGSSFILSSVNTSFDMACTCCVPCARRVLHGGYCFWCWHECWL